MEEVTREGLEAMKRARGKSGREMVESWSAYLKPDFDMEPAFKAFGPYIENAPWILESYTNEPHIKLIERDVFDAKTRELIFTAICMDTECPGGIVFHIAAAAKAGATKEEIMEIAYMSAYDYAKNHLSVIGEAVAEGLKAFD